MKAPAVILAILLALGVGVYAGARVSWGTAMTSAREACEQALAEQDYQHDARIAAQGGQP